MAKTLVHDPSLHDTQVRLIDHPIPSIHNEEGKVLVKWLAAPVNRVDLMVLSGHYPIKPRNQVGEHAIPGFDGCGIVLESTSPHFEVDDLVLPRDLGLGTWRTHAVLTDSLLIKLPRETPPVGGALLRSGALVAWLLLEEVSPLKKNDWVIMSAGTSCVAQILVQFAQRRNINTILVVRDRDHIEATRKQFLSLGATAVITESDLEKAQPKDLPGPLVMVVDCVFDRVGQDLARVLSPGGKFVMVGMLAGPQSSITVSTSHLFSRQLSFLPFRSSEVLKKMGVDRVEELIQHIASLFAKADIKLPDVRLVSWNHEGVSQTLEEAVKEAQSEEVGYQKIVWLPSD